MRTLAMACGMALTVSGWAHEYIVLPEVSKGDFPPLDSDWISRIESLAPERPTAVPAMPRKVLVFSLSTGYQHQVRPYVGEVIKVLSKKSGAFEVVFRDGIEVFEKDQLDQFDAVVLNNVCPESPARDLFLDVLGNDRQTARLETNLLNYVEAGGGLVVIHGGIAFQLNSPAVSEMLGGSFDWHPKFQTVTLDLVDPGHPLVAGFQGKGYVHQDEPYLFKNAYTNKDFRPLLVMDVEKLDPTTFNQRGVAEDVRYVAWIKRYGAGRVFYCSPSHHPASYETPAMLRFLLDGMQYALGDLKCDDAPLETRQGL